MKKLKRALVLVLVGALTVCLLAFPASAKEDFTGEKQNSGYNEIYNYDWRTTLGAEKSTAYATFYISFRTGGVHPSFVEAKFNGYGIDGNDREVFLYDEDTQYTASTMNLSDSKTIGGGVKSLYCIYYVNGEACTDLTL